MTETALILSLCANVALGIVLWTVVLLRRATHFELKVMTERHDQMLNIAQEYLVKYSKLEQSRGGQVLKEPSTGRTLYERLLTDDS